MKISLRVLLEIVGGVSLIGGLILVSYQISQTTQISRAQLESDYIDRWHSIDGTRKDSDFALILAKSLELPEQLTLAEKIQLDSFYLGVIDQMYAAYISHASGLRLVAPTVSFKTAALMYFGNEFAQNWWKYHRNDWKNYGEFRILVDKALENIENDKQLKYFNNLTLVKISKMNLD